MKKAFAYYRKSIERESEKSIEGQRTEVRRYAKENNIEIIEEFAEVASSATLKRNELQRMLRVLSEREEDDIDYILVHKFDRATREVDHIGWILGQLKEIMAVKTRLHSATESNDYEDDHFKLFFIMLQTFGATQERINAVSRMKEGRKRKADKGGFLGGTPPQGYRAVIGTGRLAVNEDEVPVVKEVFKLREQGLSMNKIATRLNDLGFTTRKGLKFYSQTVQRIIKHEKLYRGDYEDPAILN